MLRVESIVEAKVNGRDYSFHCRPDSPLDDALEAWSQIHAFLIGRKQQEIAKTSSVPSSEQEPQVKTE